MYCLRCGRDTINDQVFCPDCQQDMEAYPVKPGTHVHLPKAADVPAKKRTRRKRQLSQDEQILHLRKHLRQSRLLVVILSLVLCLALGLLVYETNALQDSDIGRNYAVDTSQGSE